MKFNFKKIASVITGAIMLTSTVGFAAAANYPAPFVVGGSPNGAIVVGANAPLDMAAAVNVKNNLNGLVTVSGGVISGEGDKVLIQRGTSDYFNLGDSASEVLTTSLDKGDLPSLLADGTYLDVDNNDFKYAQTINLGNNLNLSAFKKTSSSDPQIGIKLQSSDLQVLNYTLDFKKSPDFTSGALKNTNINMMGKDYFIQAVGDNSLTLLDSSQTATVIDGEAAQTLDINGKSYVVSAGVFSTTGDGKVKLVVNDETTTSLSVGQTYKLKDGTFVGVKDIVVQNFAGGKNQAEVTIGAGKLELTDGDLVKMNDASIDGLTAYLDNTTSAGKLGSIVLKWTTDEKTYITQNESISMPGFGNIKISMAGFVQPDQEKITVESDGSDAIRLLVPIKDGDSEINLLFRDADTGLIQGIGRATDDLLVTTSGQSLTLNESADENTFVATWNSSTEYESYLLSAKINKGTDENTTTITNVVTGLPVCEDETTTCKISGSEIILTISDLVATSGDKHETIEAGTSGISFNTIFSNNGLRIYLPYLAAAGATAKGAINISDGTEAGHNATSWYLYADEADKDGNLGKGNSFNLTIQTDSETDKELEVSAVDTGSSALRVGDTDKYDNYVLSDHGTLVVQDKSSHPYSGEIDYSKDQSYAQVYVSSPNVQVTPGEGNGVLIFKDSEVDSFKNMNLVVIGGSCVNAVAANILNVPSPTCGDAFKAATQVGAGQYIIKTIANPYLAADSGKIAMLVAGYEAADTNNGVNSILSSKPSTEVGQVIGPALV